MNAGSLLNYAVRLQSMRFLRRCAQPLFFSPHKSWEQNRQLLSQIPTFTLEDEKLVRFLQERWLAKVASYSSLAIDWAYPCFGIHHPVHPGTNHSYARLLTSQVCTAYTARMEAWKKTFLQDFPLILTRPANLQEYLPFCVEVSSIEEIASVVRKMGSREMTLDVTPLFSQDWPQLEEKLSQLCQDHKVDPNKIICFHRVSQEEIGGLRLLPLKGQMAGTLEGQRRKLLDWLSSCGLAANRVELDRWSSGPSHKKDAAPNQLDVASLQKSMDQLEESSSWAAAPAHKKLMMQGTLEVLRGIIMHGQSVDSVTKYQVGQLSIARIGQALDFLAQKGLEIPFLDLCSRLEEVHADLSALLEISMPFAPDHFASIYQELLYRTPAMPQNLKGSTSCGIHTSGMTTLSAIAKAVEKTVGRLPRVLYGENTYYECIGALNKRSQASCTSGATDDEWARVDLVVMQFNPVLQLKIDVEYGIENIAQNLRKCLDLRQAIPLTLALDCTIDFLHSPRVAALLQEFQSEIQSGALNVIGFRSGNKFDLFGMDNYCGAPFFMIHNQDPKWNAFQSLFSDGCLQADRLSLNWFCLAYQYAAPELDGYRRQIFDNTRALLGKVPAGLQKTRSGYRVSPAKPDANLAFIDIKITGPFHAYKGPALVAALFYVKSIEAGHPLFNRPSLGFYHPNCTMQFGEEHSTIRLTLGLDPAEVDLFANCLEVVGGL